MYQAFVNIRVMCIDATGIYILYKMHIYTL